MSALTSLLRYTPLSVAALGLLAGTLSAQTAPPKTPAAPATPAAPGAPAAPGTPAAPGAPAKPGAPAPAPATPAAPEAPASLNLEQETEALYADAVSNFQVGKYDVALQKIGAIKSKVSRDFEKVMFLEGACYYNLAQYDKAAEVLDQFVTKFPQSQMFVDAKINLGRSLMKKGDTEKGVIHLNEVATKYPDRKGEVGIELAEYYKSKGDLDKAEGILTIVTDGPGTSPEKVRGILMLAEIFSGKGDADKASAALNKLRASSAADDTLIQINSLGLKIGDEMREAKRYGEALVAYQSVRSRDEVLRVQKSRIATIKDWEKQAAANKRVYFLNRQISKEDIAAMLKANEEVLAELEKNKDYDAALYFRLGQCFYEMQRFYESALAFGEVYDKFHDFKDADLAAFGMIACNQMLGRFGKAYKQAEKFITEFPESSKFGAVTEMVGILAYQSGNIDDAIAAFHKAINAKGADKQRLNFLLGSTLFEAQHFDESRAAFQELLTEFKDTAYKDDAEYRIALTYFFQNDSKNTRRTLRDYIAHNPKGQYLVDANYRLAFIEYQSGEVDPALQKLQQLVKENPNDPAAGQVNMLIGDIWTKKGDSDKALAAYLLAIDKAQTPDVLSMAMEAATNILQADGKWAQLVTIWQTYYSSHPKNTPTAMKAIYYISTGMKRDKKVEEAQKFIAEAVRPQLADPKNDQVEMLLQHLVSMMAPKKQLRKSSTAKAPAPAPKPAEGAPAEGAKPAEPAATAEAKPAAAPPVTFEELEERLKKLLIPDGEASITSGCAQARVLYARALLARYMRDVNKYENLLSIIPDAAKPEELSALLLADLADMLRRKGQEEKAEAYYNRLRESFATSDYGDRAPVGLGEILYNRKEYDKALAMFNEAIEKYPGSSSLLDATLGKAKCFLATNKLESAEKIYNTIMNVKEWRSAIPVALYNLGQIYEKKREWGKAITYYTRVILAHQKYKDWLAKSYYQAAQCWINDGKPGEAKTMLQEMLRRTDIQDQPEFSEAQGLLSKIASAP